MKANTVVSGPRLARVILVTLIAVSAIAVSDSFHPPEVEAARTTTSLPSTDLFISEYIEGSGAGNKAIEIYNGTLLPVDMAAGNYVLQLYSNGAAIPSQSFNLDGTIAVGDVYVISRNDAAPAILAQIDLAAPGVINFNGDDAVVLRKGGAAGAILDAIGQVGTDPGTEWGTGLTSTADNTLVRKSSVFAGDTNPSDSFDPAAQWDGYATDTFSNLGSHAATTAADASIGGRVATAAGRGIGNIRITVSGGDLAEPRTAITSPFGYYRIDGLTAGQSYVVSAGGKRYVFDVPARLVSLGENAFDIDFVGEAR